MDIQVALNQIRQISSALEAFKDIEDFLSLVETSQAAIEEMTQEKTNLEGVISEREAAISALEVKYGELSADIQKRYEIARDAAQESLKSLKDGFNRELEEAKTLSHGKINELTEKVSQLKVEAKNLEREIKDKQAVLDDLNKSINDIKSRLG